MIKLISEVVALKTEKIVYAMVPEKSVNSAVNACQYKNVYLNSMFL